MDLVINQLNDIATIYRNNTSNNSKSPNYLRIQLKGNNKNTSGIGAKIYLTAKGGSQFQEQYFNRGFQSSVDPILHFGLGNDSVVQKLKVLWPTGELSEINNVKANQLLIIEQKKASKNNIIDLFNEAKKSKPKFQDVTKQSGIEFIDKGSDFVDFKVSPLLPYQISKIGPCIAKADVNGDGLEDLFIGAGNDQKSQLYLQTKDGHFILSPNQPWNLNTKPFNADALFFDADGDGDMDLYLVSGGAEYPYGNENYQDRIFENDGKGNFKELLNALPKETISGSCARSADIYHNGKQDIFIGGRFKPGMFPESPPSYILKNISTSGNIKFIIDKSQNDNTLNNPGMVTDAVWSDINNDGWLDLIVVGQFMPITIFENHNGMLINKTKEYGLEKTNGWWNRIMATDLNKDGKEDFIVGNLGLNTQLKATENQPVSITYSDYSGEGTIMPILCYFIQGKSYPYYTRDELLDQIPWLQKKFGTYTDFADAQLTDLFSSEKLAAAKTVKIKTLNSISLTNLGNHKMIVKNLPIQAQTSTVNGIISDDSKDLNHIIIAGNFYPFRSQFGPLDAGIGGILQKEANSDFSFLSYHETGLNISGDVRNMIKVKSLNGGYFLVVAKSNDAIQVIKANK